MNFFEQKRGATATMSQDTTARQLTPTTSQHSVELCDVRLDLQLSRETLSRMSEVDHRTTRAFTTATRFAFR